MLQARIPRTCVWQGVARYRPGGCLRNHTVRFTLSCDWHGLSNHIGPMRDLLLAILKDEMMRHAGNHREVRRLEALHDALAFRRSVDLAFNPTFWRVSALALGAEKAAKMARIMQVLH